MPYLLFLLLSLPIFGSWYFSYDTNIVPVLLSLVALAGACVLIFHASTRLSSAVLRKTVFTAACLVIAGFQLARLVSFYFQGTSFNTQFFFHLELDNAMQAWTAYLPILLISFVFMLATLMVSLRSSLVHRSSPKPVQLLLLALFVTLLEPDILGYLQYRQELADNSYLETMLVDDAILRQHNLNPEALTNGAGPPAIAGRNLVLIYLESLEATYLDTTIFGNLTPNLQRLSNSGLNFSNTSESAGTSFTMAGIVSSQCGTPLLFAAAPNGNDILNNGFLNNVYCMSDVLDSAGYQQVFLGGAGLDFAGKGQFLKDHRYDLVLGRDELAAKLPDSDYQTGWGLYDDSLLTIARDEYRRLADSGSPFNLTLLTLDTHHPIGEASASCPRYAGSDNTMLQAVHCSDYLVDAFLSDIAQHPAWENTVVVLVSDHYAMRNAAQRLYPPLAERRLLFTILNAGQKRDVGTPATLMDVAPTVLDVMAVKHSLHFLAGNSLLDQPSALQHRTYSGENIEEYADEYAAEKARTNLIRHINSSILTSKSVQLCETDQLLSKASGHIRIAGRDIAISSRGARLPEGSLRLTHTFVAFWDKAGYLLNSMIVENAELPGLLYRLRGENFITLGNKDALSDYLLDNANGQGEQELVALVGNLLGSVHTLAIQDAGGAVVADSLACGRILSAINASFNPESEHDVIEAYCTSSPANSFMNVDRSSMHLDLVYYEGNWFEAELRRNAAGQYFPASYQPLEVAGDETCFAQISDTEMIIPNISIDGEARLLSLTRLPGDELLFEIN